MDENKDNYFSCAPPKRRFRCGEHGVFEESGVFPNTLGIQLSQYPGGPKVRFCPVCFFNMVRDECFELKEIVCDD